MATTTSTIVTTNLNSVYETATVFHRENGDSVNFSVMHFGSHHKLDIAIYAAVDESLDDTGIEEDIHLIEESNCEPIPCELDGPIENVVLTYQEARILRALLNKPEVAALLDQE